MEGVCVDHIAHIREKDGQVQTVREHSRNVAKLASRLGNKIGAKHLAFISGYFHDIGKLSTEFSDYILSEVNRDKDSKSRRGSVDHSTAGGKLLYHCFHENATSVPRKMVTEIVTNVILSHHTGLLDYLSLDGSSDYLRRVTEKEILEYEGIKQDVFESFSYSYISNVLRKGEVELEKILKKNSKSSRDCFLTISFLTKYLFSCLIDADRTDARCFEENIPLPQADCYSKDLFEGCYNLLIKHLYSLNTYEALNPITRLRNHMSKECDLFADRKSGIYSLSIPTGGGKTLSSLRYALKHAVKHGKDRIIYVIPYTSVIEQNADEVRNILEEYDVVLEHHSNVFIDENPEDELSYQKAKKYKLVKDNWDSPIIFTTVVQFLDVIYAKGTRNIRRFHNLANSVIIFDEVQSVPLKCISMFNAALNFLKNVCKCSILLCTATQPALDFVERSIDAIDGEIIQDLGSVVDSFKRVEVIDKLKPAGWSTSEIADFALDIMEEENSLLVVLNTKKVARELYQELYCKEKDSKIVFYHLSTSMCAANRKDILNKVKKHLENHEKVVCVSTQLIEAGVNISFDCVIRSLAGLDSIAQAAGRCNRHGESTLKSVYVINHNEENLSRLRAIKTGGEIAERILIDKRNNDLTSDLFSPEIMELYFQNYYTEMQGELDYYVKPLNETLYSLLQGNNKYKQYYQDKTGQLFPLLIFSSLGTVGEYFRVIDQKTKPVLVPYGNGKELIADLNENIDIDQANCLLRNSQQYMVNVFDYEFQILCKERSIIPKMDQLVFVLRENAYDSNLGICIKDQGKMSFLGS